MANKRLPLASAWGWLLGTTLLAAMMVFFIVEQSDGGRVTQYDEAVRGMLAPREALGLTVL